MVSLWLTSAMLSGGYPCKVEMVQIFATLLDMSDSCLLQSFRSISTSYYYDENYMDDDDYFVVMA
jgi:hypothetical protein